MVPAVVDRQFSMYLYTLLSVLISGYGLYGAFRRIPFLNQNPSVTLALVFVSLCGFLVIPTLHSKVLECLFWTMFPASAILGVFTQTEEV